MYDQSMVNVKLSCCSAPCTVKKKDREGIAAYQLGGALLPQASDGKRITVSVEVDVSNRMEAINTAHCKSNEPGCRGEKVWMIWICHPVLPVPTDV